MVDGGKKVKRLKRRYGSDKLEEYEAVMTAFHNFNRKIFSVKNRFKSVMQRSSAKRDEEVKNFRQRLLNMMNASIVAFKMNGTPLPDVDEQFEEASPPYPTTNQNSAEPLFKAVRAAAEQMSLIDEFVNNSIVDEPDSLEPVTKALEAAADHISVIEEFVNHEEFVLNNSNQPDVVELSPVSI